MSVGTWTLGGAAVGAASAWGGCSAMSGCGSSGTQSWCVKCNTPLAIAGGAVLGGAATGIAAYAGSRGTAPGKVGLIEGAVAAGVTAGAAFGGGSVGQVVAAAAVNGVVFGGIGWAAAYFNRPERGGRHRMREDGSMYEDPDELDWGALLERAA